MKFKMARYTVKPENLEAVREAVAELVEAIKQNEPDTFYETYQEENSPTFIHLMFFDSLEAEQSHGSSAHCDKFVKFLYPLCSQEPVFTDLMLLRSSEL